MNNYLRVMAIHEEEMHRVVFVNGRQEAGFGAAYDPALGRESYHVFVHSTLPYKEAALWEFPTFSEARLFAAKEFSTPWEFLVWGGELTRPCAKDGACGCASEKNGGSSCSTKGGGGCSTCQTSSEPHA